jgi:HTH-type transcriptional regulator/antitoxin HipB
MKTHWLWDTTLSEKRVKRILHNERNPRFYIYAEKLFSRVRDPREAFGYISKETFCRKWPVLKKRIEKDAWAKSKADFWQGIYKQTLEESERLNVAQQIKKLRHQVGYTQEEMAKRLGVIQQYISSLESGRENLTLDTLKKIAQVFNKNLVIQLS